MRAGVNMCGSRLVFLFGRAILGSDVRLRWHFLSPRARSVSRTSFSPLAQPWSMTRFIQHAAVSWPLIASRAHPINRQPISAPGMHSVFPPPASSPSSTTYMRPPADPYGRHGSPTATYINTNLYRHQHCLWVDHDDPPVSNVGDPFRRSMRQWSTWRPTTFELTTTDAVVIVHSTGPAVHVVSNKRSTNWSTTTASQTIRMRLSALW